MDFLQVYKILVKKNQEDSWVIFRRYTDFSRLNDKVRLGIKNKKPSTELFCCGFATNPLCVCVQLKELFPRFRLSLPPKRWFKDNYDMEFLEERQIGLQTFLQNLIAHKDIINRYLQGVCVCVC